MKKIYSLLFSMLIIFSVAAETASVTQTTNSKKNLQYSPQFKLVKKIQHLMLEKIRLHETLSKDEIIDDIVATAMMNPEFLQRFYGESATYLESDLKQLTKAEIIFVEKRRLEQVSRCENYFFLLSREVNLPHAAAEMITDIGHNPMKHFWIPIPLTLEAAAIIAVDVAISPLYLLKTAKSCFEK